MAIDIETEEMVPITRSPMHIPGRPHISTVVRWCTRGVRGLVLESVIVGGRRFTSVEALSRFVAHLSSPGVATSSRVTQQQRAEMEAVERRLDGHGIK